MNPQEKPPLVYVSRIKHDDQRKDKQGLYRRVRKWDLSELRLIDGKTADTEVHYMYICIYMYMSL